MLCGLLGGKPPSKEKFSPGHSKTRPHRGVGGERPGENTTGDVEGSVASATTEGGSASPSSSWEEIKRENSGGAGGGGEIDGGVDGAIDVGVKGGWGEKPEKSHFNVLLGMLTIATMVGPGGEATASWATDFASGLNPEEKEDIGQAGSGTRTGRTIAAIVVPL